MLLPASTCTTSPPLVSPTPAPLSCASKLAISTTKKVSSSPVVEYFAEDPFPLMAPITNQEIEGAPKYLRSQIDGDKLNEIVLQLNAIVKGKRDSRAAKDLLELEDLEQKLQLGRMAKVIILVLIKLRRLEAVHQDGKTSYQIVAKHE